MPPPDPAVQDTISSHFPEDVMISIFEWSRAMCQHEMMTIFDRRQAGRQFFHLCIVCKAWTPSATRALYSDVYLVSPQTLRLFARTVTARRERLALVKSLHIWNYAHIYGPDASGIMGDAEGWNELLLGTLYTAQTQARTDGRIRTGRRIALPRWLKGAPRQRSTAQLICEPISQAPCHRLSVLQLALVVNDRMSEIIQAINTMSTLKRLTLLWDSEPEKEVPQGRYLASPGLYLPNLRQFTWDSTNLGGHTLVLLNTPAFLAACRFSPACFIALRGELGPGAVPGPFFTHHALGSWVFADVGATDALWLACALENVKGQLTYPFRAFAHAVGSHAMDGTEASLPAELTLLDSSATPNDRRKVLGYFALRSRTCSRTIVHVRSSGRDPEALPSTAYDELQKEVESLRERNVTLVVHL